MRYRTMTDQPRMLRRVCALGGLSLALGAWTYSTGEVVTASVPDDYRQRHPIAIQEANRSIVIFGGNGRGGLAAAQRADVLGLAQGRVGGGTGAIGADVPADTPNARAAASSFQEIRALLAAGGGPPPRTNFNPHPPPAPP